MKEQKHKPAVCFDCRYRRNGTCWLHAIPRDKQDEPCEKFKAKGGK